MRKNTLLKTKNKKQKKTIFVVNDSYITEYFETDPFTPSSSE